MNPRRVAITAAALFGTVILVGGVIAAVAGFEMGEAGVSNADAVSTMRSPRRLYRTVRSGPRPKQYPRSSRQ
jgi:hypothetical protein